MTGSITYDRDAVLGCFPVALQSCLRLGVHIVDLQLAEVPVARGENGAENVEAVVEREAEITDFSRLFHLFAELDCAEFLQFFPLCRVERVQQIEIYVVGLQPCKLFVEYAFDIRRRLQRPRRQLRRQKIGVARVFCQCLAQKRLAFAVVVGISGVNIY